MEMKGKNENTKTVVSQFTFNKKERLCSQKLIEKLFSDGDSFFCFPLKVVYSQLPLPSKYPARVAFSVSKKNVKKAVQRNRIKRLMRESYRLNKNGFYRQISEKKVAVFFIFVGKEMPRYCDIEAAMQQCLKKLGTRINNG
jgi:ribonuclease P protein component